MSHSPDLSPPQAAPSTPTSLPPAKPAEPPAPIWLQRTSVVILVVFCFYVGLLLFVLPWTRYWNLNSYLLTFPGFVHVMNSGITRGIVSGLGLLDFWIGISEITHYRDYRP